MLLIVPFLLAAVSHARVVVESLQGPPPGWQRVRDADPRQPLRLQIALEHAQPGLLEQTLFSVSDPAHPHYGRHLGRAELDRLTAPSDEAAAAVLDWLSGAGIAHSRVDRNSSSEWIDMSATVREAEALLDTRFAVFGHAASGTQRLRALHYSVPDAVAPHVALVAPVVGFGRTRPQQRRATEVPPPEGPGIEPANSSIPAAPVPSFHLDAALCNTTVTPECLRALYHMGDFQAGPSNRSLLGIAGFVEEWPKYDQLARFSSVYAPYARDANFSFVSINGGGSAQDADNPDGEANLDTQYAMAMAYKMPAVFYSTGGRAPFVPDLDRPDPDQSYNEPYLDLVKYLLRLPDSELPQTLTLSFTETEQEIPPRYAVKVCQLFGQLGVRGVSVIFATGDDGPGSSCQTNDGKNTTRFLPNFPASCPYVTSVGATARVRPEIAASLSAGGFSDLFSRPRYQDAAVSEYLARLGGRWQGLFSPGGRAFPDVAVQGENYRVFKSGREWIVDGTSASAPAFAGMVALLNNARLRAGRPPMGFLNPWLYSVGRAGLTDIIHGGSVGCTGTAQHSGLPAPYVPYAGWNATVGWDPATGLGTPLVDRLLNLSTPGWSLPRIGE